MNLQEVDRTHCHGLRYREDRPAAISIIRRVQMDKVMTLEAYDPDRLDLLALRLLDVCGRVRILASRCRDEELTSVTLHDRKALEWIDKLEDWLARSEGDVNRAVLKARGEQRARQSKSTRP